MAASPVASEEVERRSGPLAEPPPPLFVTEDDRVPAALGRPGTASRRNAPRRAPAAGRLLVPRDEQRTSFGNSRPRRDLDDGADGARAGGSPHLAQAFVEPLTELRPLGADELELVPPGRSQLDELEAEGRHRRRQLGQLRPERRAEPVALGGRVAERRRPAPGGAADHLRRHGELADEPIGPLRPGEDRVDERRERASDRELVVDRLRELDRLGDLGGGAAAPPRRGPPPPPPPPPPPGR